MACGTGCTDCPACRGEVSPDAQTVHDLAWGMMQMDPAHPTWSALYAAQVVSEGARSRGGGPDPIAQFVQDTVNRLTPRSLLPWGSFAADEPPAAGGSGLVLRDSTGSRTGSPSVLNFVPYNPQRATADLAGLLTGKPPQGFVGDAVAQGAAGRPSSIVAQSIDGDPREDEIRKWLSDPHNVYDYVTDENGDVIAGCRCVVRKWIEKVHPLLLWYCWKKITCFGNANCEGEWWYRHDCSPRRKPPTPVKPERPWWYDLPPCPETSDEIEDKMSIGEPWCSEGKADQEFHPGAYVCYREVVRTRIGPAQQCCCNDGGNLITEGQAAGTPDKVSTMYCKDNDRRDRANEFMREHGELLRRHGITIDMKLVSNCDWTFWNVVDHYWADVNPFKIYRDKGFVEGYLSLWPPSGSLYEIEARARYDAALADFTLAPEWDPK